jgi:hypothetical protein
MSLIDQLIEEIQQSANIQGMPSDGSGNLTLKATDFELDFMKAFLTKLLKVRNLTLTRAVINVKQTPAANSIAITGSGELLGYPNLALFIVFDVQGDEVVGTATGVLDPLSTMALPVLTWIKVGDIVLTTSIHQTFELITLAFKGNILVNKKTGAKIPIEIEKSTRFRMALRACRRYRAGYCPQ